MGLTKQYLRYAPGGTFNIIVSPNCNSVHVVLNGVSGRYIAVGACEHVIIWDLRLAEKAQVLPGEKSQVTRLSCSPTGNHLAVGYADGNIQVFDLTKAEVVCVFAGHTSGITALEYDEQGHRLVSGAKDTEVILWDVIAESGISRFSGHKGPITDVHFLNSRNCIVSSSKDTFVKFWDIETTHCFKTLGGHRAEVWACSLLKSETFLVTGSSDQELKVWKLCWTNDKTDKVEILSKHLEIVKLEEGENTEDSVILQCHQVGTLMRGGRGRVVGLVSDPGTMVLGCFGTDSLFELFMFCSDEEAQARMTKRVKKLKKKLEKAKEEGEKKNDEAEIKVTEMLTLTDEVRRLNSIKLSAKIKSVSLVLGATAELRCGVTLANNTIELHSVDTSSSSAEVRCLKEVSQQGHHSEVRCVALSSDNLAILSASGESIKLWNRSSQTCLRTISTGGSGALSVCFAPGDRHALVGRTDGRLLVCDVAAGDVLEEVPAHTAECWSVGLTPDQRGCYSGGGDKTVKLWQFELIDDPSGETRAKVLSLLHTRTLELEETVLSVRISPNSKFIAVGLLDSTVKIFFLDTFKFYLSLYGHKLPILCMDISYDSTIIATGSADRSVKIWGLDFGDCHRSIFAHDDSVTGLQFVPATHYFFTSSKDGKVKQWDADTYENIITLPGHAGESWGVSVGAGGLHAASCGADRVLRLWSRTDETLVLGDQDDEDEGLATGEKAPVPGLPNLNMPSKKTIGAEKAAESILECLEVGSQFRQEQELSHAPVQPPLLMKVLGVTNAEDYLLETIRKIRASDLEEALLLLPFSAACHMVGMLPGLLERPDHTELLCRLSCFLLRLHHAPLVSNKALLKDIIQIQAKATLRLKELRDMVGYNLHAFMWMSREVEARQGEALFREVVRDQQTRNRKKKSRQALKRPIVVVS